MNYAGRQSASSRSRWAWPGGAYDRGARRARRRPTARPTVGVALARGRRWSSRSSTCPLVVVIVYAFHDSSIIAWPLRLGTLRVVRGAVARPRHDRGRGGEPEARAPRGGDRAPDRRARRVRARSVRVSREDRVPPAGPAAAHPARDHHRRVAAHLLQLRGARALERVPPRSRLAGGAGSLPRR